MSTILEIAPSLTVVLSNGKVTSDEPIVAEIGEQLWNQECAQGYLPWPEWRWTERMRRPFPSLKVVQMDKAQPSEPGVVY